jgi:hypothetical protein
MARVLNKYKDEIPPDAIYIGRPSPWGNPFVITNTRTREEAVIAYENWIFQAMDLETIKEKLAGKDLVCFCAPKPCHGDILLRIANS